MGRLRDVRCHERFEQRGLGAERSEERDFVDAGLDGDEARRRAAEAVLGVDSFCGVENSVADVHGAHPKAGLALMQVPTYF